MPTPAPPVAVTPSATPHEAAAITAAIAQFRRDTTPPPPAPAPRRDAWQRAALLEATGREPDAPSPWGDPVAWG